MRRGHCADFSAAIKRIRAKKQHGEFLRNRAAFPLAFLPACSLMALMGIECHDL
jgi:hypothetical protein